MLAQSMSTSFSRFVGEVKISFSLLARRPALPLVHARQPLQRWVDRMFQNRQRSPMEMFEVDEGPTLDGTDIARVSRRRGTWQHPDDDLNIWLFRILLLLA